MKRIVYIILLAIISAETIQADTREQRMQNRHELRFGIGDPVMSYYHRIVPVNSDYIYHNVLGMEAAQADYYMRTHFYETATGRKHLSGNLFVDYQYSITSWFSAGGQINFSASWRGMQSYDGYGNSHGHYFKSLTYLHVMPEIRFTFFHREHCNLYAGVGGGFVAEIFTNDNMDYWGRPYNNRNTYSWVIDFTFLGVSWGGEKVFGFAEFGAMFEPMTYATMDRVCRAGIGFHLTSTQNSHK